MKREAAARLCLHNAGHVFASSLLRIIFNLCEARELSAARFGY